MRNLGLLAFLGLMTWSCSGGGGGGPAIYGTFAVTSAGADPFESALKPDAKWVRFEDDDFYYVLRESAHGLKAVDAGVFIASRTQVNMDGTLFNYAVTGTALTLTRPGETYSIMRDPAAPAVDAWAPVISEITSVPIDTTYTSDTDVAWDGTNIWIGNAYSGTALNIVNPTTGAVTPTLKMSHYAWGIGWDGANLWVSSNGYDRVTELDMVTGANLTVSPPLGAWIYGVAFDGTDVWAFSNNEQSLYRFTPGDTVVDETIDLRGEVMYNGGGLEYANGALYFAVGDTVQRCTPSPFQCTQAWRIPGTVLSGIAFDGTDFLLYGGSGTENESRRLIRAQLP